MKSLLIAVAVAILAVFTLLTVASARTQPKQADFLGADSLPGISVGLGRTTAEQCPNAGGPPVCMSPQHPVCVCMPDGQGGKMCTWMCE